MSDEALRLYCRYSLWFDNVLRRLGYRSFTIEWYQRRGQHIAEAIDLEIADVGD